MSILVVAVDPGPSYTGVVARQGDELVAWMVAVRADRQVTEPLVDHAERTHSVICEVGDEAEGLLNVDIDVFAVEDYNPPTPHVGYVDPLQVSETAWLTGFCYGSCRELARWVGPRRRAVLVPPNRHGRSLLGAYPEELTTEGERRGNWRWRAAGRNTLESHARSAWDVAGAAPAQLRIAEVDK